MTPKAYRTMVGAFVAGGIALFTAGMILLGSGKFFTESLSYTLYFDGSVSGLSVGAPVVFRGVPMGSVTQISLVANARDSNISIPVTIRIDNKSFIRANGQPLPEHAQAEIIRRMVERGLRARLQIGSLITGQYKVELDFFPNMPMNFRSANPETEIPTVPSPIDTLQKTFARLPLDEIADSLTTILANLTDAVGNNQLKVAINSFTSLMDDARDLINKSEIRNAMENTFSQVDVMTKSIQHGLPGALNSFSSAMNSLSRAAEELRKVADSAESALGRDSATMNDLRRLLRDAAAASRALKNFADMLERNPEALLKGRQGTR